ncbi:VOC family protein [Amycolatopsis jejuensis]|uniref:VOC family protein n=1 Tax=Amycolatopsis jejuensis TaxID=330084 RepID=UPI000524E1D4|nr:VOC family protein [Amycolatopsis jejuensis]
MVPKTHKIEHVEFSVADLGRTLDFYLNVVGMVELAREDGTVYLGCGLDDNWDVAFREGPPRIEHVAFRVDHVDEIDQTARRLADHGIAVRRCDGTEPGQEQGIRFTLPSGLDMEYVSVADKRYPVLAAPAHPRLRGFHPLDLDHIAIQAPDVSEISRFFLDVLGWKETEHIELNPGSGVWEGAFMRKGSLHHDVTVNSGTGRLHHWALALSSFEHLKLACDTLASAGLAIELGPGRHLLGGNIFVYYRTPDGNRLELSLEMAVIDGDMPPKAWHDRSGFDAWGACRPTPEFFIGT